MKAEHIESCYTPIIQSGGKYDLRASATSNDDPMHAGVIVASLGARYKGYWYAPLLYLCPTPTRLTPVTATHYCTQLEFGPHVCDQPVEGAHRGIQSDGGLLPRGAQSDASGREAQLRV